MIVMSAELKGVPVSALKTVVHVDSDGVHECKKLKTANASRVKEGESTLSVFKDDDGYYLRVGLEFVKIVCCPLCGEGL